MRAPRQVHPALPLAVIVLGGLALRLWGLTWGLHDATVSRRPHPDEWVVYWVFRWFDRYSEPNPCPTPQTQCFFDWGGLYLYLGYIARQVLDVVTLVIPLPSFGARADGEFIRAALAGRLLSVVMSTGTIVIGYLLGKALNGRAAGLIAAGIIALSGLLVQLCHFATPDSTTIFFLSLTLLLAVEAARAPSSARFAAAGASAGLATGSEYHMGLLLLPVLGAWLMAGRARNGLLLSLLAFVVAWAVANPFAVLQPAAFLDANLHSLRIRTVESGAEYGDRWSQYGPAWLYVVRYPFGYGVGFAMTVWLVAGAIWAIARRRRLDLLVVLWIVAYFILVTLSPAKFMRYSAPLIPPLAVLAGVFAVDLWGMRAAVVRPLVLAAAVATALYSLAYDAAYAQLFSAQDPRQVTTSWIQRHAARHSQIGFEEIPDGLVNLPYFVVDAGYRPCFSGFHVYNLRSPVTYFAVDDYALEQHPVDVGTSGVRAFRSALARDPAYRRVFRVDPVPSFAGLTFPIGHSPHDWRYPAHTITVYGHVGGERNGSGGCYPSLRQALIALHTRPAEARG